MISKKEAGMAGGKPVYEYTLENTNGLKLQFFTYGGVVRALFAPDKNGRPVDVQMGHDTLQGYLANPSFYGAAVGRYANRLGKGEFTVDGHTYHLDKNENGNTLHGGDNSFNTKIWDVAEEKDGEEPFVTLRYVSPDGENGFPGTVTMDMTYTLTKENGWKIEYRGTTDKATALNMTNHSFFNLNGDGESAMDHILWIDADRYTAADGALLPTGELVEVKGTPMDFTEPKPVARDLNADYGALTVAGGYDSNYVINHWNKTVKKIAALSSEKSGIVMDVYTDKPGVQLYTDNNPVAFKAKGGARYPLHAGICLETQLFPDSPNHDDFPGGITRPGETYAYTTIYQFSVSMKR